MASKKFYLCDIAGNPIDLSKLTAEQIAEITAVLKNTFDWLTLKQKLLKEELAETQEQMKK